MFLPSSLSDNGEPRGKEPSSAWMTDVMMDDCVLNSTTVREKSNMGALDSLWYVHVLLPYRSLFFGFESEIKSYVPRVIEI